MIYRHHGIVDLCDDCKQYPPVVTFGLGAVRCAGCALIFQSVNRASRAEREKKEQEELKAHQDAGCPDDGVTCPECCEHEFDWDEGYTCLNCGEQGEAFA